MHIAIRKRSELKMLRQINPFLTRYKIPREVLNRVEGIFSNKDLGKDGYVAIILEPINDDCSDVMEELNLDYTLVEVPDNNYYQIPVKGKKHPMKRKRQWNSYDIVLSENRGKIYVIYSMTKNRLRELGVI